MRAGGKAEYTDSGFSRIRFSQLPAQSDLSRLTVLSPAFKSLPPLSSRVVEQIRAGHLALACCTYCLSPTHHQL